MTGSQVLLAVAGGAVLLVGLWLLLRGQEERASTGVQAGIVAFQGPPAVLLVILGLAGIVFPFTPWWPGDDTASPPPGAGEVPVPGVIGMVLEEAEQTVGSAGLGLLVVNDPPPACQPLIVEDQSPPEGEPIPEGSPVSVVVRCG